MKKFGTYFSYQFTEISPSALRIYCESAIHNVLPNFGNFYVCIGITNFYISSTKSYCRVGKLLTEHLDCKV